MKVDEDFKVIEQYLCIRMPTPIEVEMRMYERDVNDTLIETAQREGNEIEVS